MFYWWKVWCYIGSGVRSALKNTDVNGSISMYSHGYVIQVKSQRYHRFNLNSDFTFTISDYGLQWSDSIYIYICMLEQYICMMGQSQWGKCFQLRKMDVSRSRKCCQFLPVGPIFTNNSADQTLIVPFASRFFSCSSWKNVTEDADLWGLFLNWKQQNWVMEILYCF